MMEHPARLIIIGFGLLAFGAVLPFMMVLKLLESTLFLNFLCVFAQVFGMTIGFIGITHFRQYPRRRK
jgi:hypothetical protein